MIRPKNDTEDLLLSITENCEKTIEKTHRKGVKTLEIKLAQPRETFQFNPPISIESCWMKGLTSIEVYISSVNINTANSKF